MLRARQYWHQYRIAIRNTAWLAWRLFFILPFSSWVHFLFSREREMLLPIGEVTISIRAARLRDKLVDCYMAVSCAQERQYNPQGFGLDRGQTVVDIGGHIGSFAVFAARKITPGRVFVYEPDPENFSKLERNIEVNRASEIVAFPCGIAGAAGKRLFYQDNLNTAVHGLYQEGARAITINTLTLQDVFSQNGIEQCDFLKMDCEGAEYEIFMNAPKEIFTRIKKIVLEYHNPPFYGLNIRDHNPQTLAALFRDAGFQVRMVPENAMHGLLFATH